MRQMVERLRQRIATFAGQRDDFVLVVRCSEADCGLVIKIIEGLDESSTSELYWVVIDAFDSPSSFVEACVQSFRIKHDAVRLVLQSQNRPAWPPVPARILDPAALPPINRLRELIVFSRSLLPTLNGCAVVWGLLPMRIEDGDGYVELMTALWQHEFPFPWCHHVRMVVRDDFPVSLLSAVAAGAPRVTGCAVDFSPDAIRQALEQEAGDEAAPLSDRVNSCLMLAGIEYSHGRYDRAIQQYDVVHQYAAASQNPTLAAVALNGMGDALRAQGRVDAADLVLQSALAPAALAPQPPVPVLLDLYGKLGELRLSQERWEEAEVFLRGAADFAVLQRDPDQRLRHLELLGEAQYRQGKTTLASKTWYAGAVVAGKLGRDEERERFVRALRSHYATVGDNSSLARVMDAMRREIAAHDPDAVDPETIARIHGNR